MTLLYNKIQRGIPGKPEEPKKWYISLKTLGQIGEKEVARQIADETTLNPKEAEMALAQLEKILIRLLLDGHTVQLGDWGSFYLTLNSTGTDTEKDASPARVNSINIRFKPGKELKTAIAAASFKPAADMTTK